jgi:hypothetical protein
MFEDIYEKVMAEHDVIYPLKGCMCKQNGVFYSSNFIYKRMYEPALFAEQHG